MKLFYITNARIPTEKAHGLQIMKSCEAFAKDGIDTTLILPVKPNRLNSDPFDYYGVDKVFKIKKVFSLDLLWLPIVPQRVTFFIQALSFALPVSIIALMFLKRKDAILYSRDYATLLFLCLWGLRPVAEVHDYRSKNPKKLISFILKRSRKVIANSYGTKEALLEHYKDLQNIEVTPNGVDVDFFDIEKTQAEARKELGMAENQKIIAYVGSLETVGVGKGVDCLIKAFNLINNKKDCILYVVGGPERAVKSHKLFAEELGLNDSNIKFTGHIEYKKIPVYLRAFDVVVIPLPRTKHGFTTSPIKLFEFMAAGKAIVASDLPSLRAYIKNDEAIFFEPENYKELSEKIDFLVANPSEIEKLSFRARNLSHKHTWTQRAKSIVGLFNASKHETNC